MTDEKDEQEVYLVCQPVSESKWELVTINNSQTLCEQCDEYVWISATGIKIQEERGALPICIGCAFLFGMMDKEWEPPTDEQLQEIAAATSPEYAAKIKHTVDAWNETKRRDDATDTTVPDQPRDGKD